MTTYICICMKTYFAINVKYTLQMYVLSYAKRTLINMVLCRYVACGNLYVVNAKQQEIAQSIVT